MRKGGTHPNWHGLGHTKPHLSTHTTNGTVHCSKVFDGIQTGFHKAEVHSPWPQRGQPQGGNVGSRHGQSPGTGSISSHLSAPPSGHARRSTSCRGSPWCQRRYCGSSSGATLPHSSRRSPGPSSSLPGGAWRGRTSPRKKTGLCTLGRSARLGRWANVMGKELVFRGS